MEGCRNVDVYLYCKKNHVAKLGLHGTDGCRLPGILSQARILVCGCHRNFHLKKTILVGSEPLVSQAPKENSRPQRIRLKNKAQKQIRVADYAERHGWRMPGRKGERSELKSLCAELGMLEKQVGDWMYPRKKGMRCVSL